jgi:hypothetical protein
VIIFQMSGHVHTLDLSKCHNVSDIRVSALGHVHTLNVRYCDNFLGVSLDWVMSISCRLQSRLVY